MPTPPDTFPIGSVIIYSGNVSHSSSILSLGRMGWVPCDGSLLRASFYTDLFNAIGTAHGGHTAGHEQYFNVPDMNGMFVRGVNGHATNSNNKPVDPECFSRGAPHNPGANNGNKVGSIQDFTTANPNSAFALNETGAHSHDLHHMSPSWHHAHSGTTKQMSNHKKGGSDVDTTGKHSHVISAGGDKETRPCNLVLGWVIRFQ